MAGLTFELIGLPESVSLPSPWTDFIRAEPVVNPDVRVSLSRVSDLLKPEGHPLNDNAFFKLYARGSEGGLLGVPVKSPEWQVFYKPGRLDVRVDEARSSSRNWAELADYVLWRFQSLIFSQAGRLVFHAMAAIRGGQANLFIGDSGKGKSTLGRILHEAGWTVLSDESPIVEACPDGGFKVWGSPWPSSGGFAVNRSAPLTALFFLEHGAANRLDPLSAGETAKKIIGMRQVLCPWYLDALRDRVLDRMEDLVRSVPCSVLYFKPDATVVKQLGL